MAWFSCLSKAEREVLKEQVVKKEKAVEKAREERLISLAKLFGIGYYSYYSNMLHTSSSCVLTEQEYILENAEIALRSKDWDHDETKKKLALAESLLKGKVRKEYEKKYPVPPVSLFCHSTIIRG
jgi:hypothetical protein